MARSKRSSERAASVSSMRTTKAPPAWRATRKLYSAVRAEPMCSVPVGLGAKRTLTVWSRLMVAPLSAYRRRTVVRVYVDRTAPSGGAGGRLQGTRPANRGRTMDKPSQTPAQAATPYIDALLAYRTRGFVPFHTPGHKLGKGAPDVMREVFGSALLAVDVAMAGGVEDTRESTALVRGAEDLAAAAWGGERCFFLVNGSTSGIHSLLLSLAGPGDSVDRAAQRPQVACRRRSSSRAPCRTTSNPRSTRSGASP